MSERRETKWDLKQALDNRKRLCFHSAFPFHFFVLLTGVFTVVWPSTFEVLTFGLGRAGRADQFQQQAEAELPSNRRLWLMSFFLRIHEPRDESSTTNYRDNSWVRVQSFNRKKMRTVWRQTYLGTSCYIRSTSRRKSRSWPRED